MIQITNEGKQAYEGRGTKQKSNNVDYLWHVGERAAVKSYWRVDLADPAHSQLMNSESFDWKC